MVKQQFRETDLGRKIKGIEFGPASAGDLRQSSHMEVWRSQFYEEGKKFEPAEGGPLDKRLGVSKEPATCHTCGQTATDCIGHYGYVDLQLPVFHVGYFRLALQVLQCICKSCSRVLMNDEKREQFLKVARFLPPDSSYLRKKGLHKQIVEACKKVSKGICRCCGFRNGVVKKAVGAPLKIVHVTGPISPEIMLRTDGGKELSQILDRCKLELLTPLDVWKIFDRIPEEDVTIIFGRATVNHPRDLLVRRIPVPPVCIRPSIVSDAKSTEDDLTSRIIEIIHLNTAIVKNSSEGAFMPKITELWDTLQIQCALFINSELAGIPQNMKPKKFQRSLAQRLKGKQGRFRQNLSGKRVDFSGRTVISPDPNLRINEVGVPIHVAKILTYPERVTKANREELRRLVMVGAHNHPGANYIEKKSDNSAALKTSLFVLSEEKRKEQASRLRLGDVVERHLRDGDIVLFNRQPSLHKISIMSHRAKVFPGRTFRFNECVCTPYNADFDGDEMNLHLPQTEEARAEATILMGVSSNLVTPRSGEPLVAAIQDFITAAYLLTSKDRFFTRQQVSQMIGSIIGGPDSTLRIDIPQPAILKPRKLWTGKQVFSLIIRPNSDSPIKLNMRAKAKVCDLDDDMSPKDTFVVIRNGELMCGVMEKATLGSGSKSNMFFKIMKVFGEQPAIDCMWRLGRLAPVFLSNHGFSIGIGDVTPGPGLLREKQLLLDEGYSACKDLITQFEDGRLKTRPGQTEAETLEALILNKLSNIREAAGKACHRELSPYNSPLIMAICGSKGSNINISQMIASVGQQTISGNRAPDGFEQRSLPHFQRLEKTPEAKGFVEDSFYSGLTPTEFFFHTMAGREGLVDTAVKTAETGYMQRRLVKCLEDLCAHYDDTIRTSGMEVVQFRYGDDGLDPTYMEGTEEVFQKPYLLAHCKAVHHTSNVEDKLPPEDMETLISSIVRDKLSDCDQLFRDDISSFLISQVREASKYFSVKGSCEQHPGDHRGRNKCKDCQKARELKEFLLKAFCLSAREAREFLEAGRIRWKRALVEPGTSVGAVGATSIGEPSTQMTLKTFHFAGVASMNITRGVPRIKEIINAVKNISTPVIVAPMLAEGEAGARKVKGRVEKTKLGEICEYIEDVYLSDEFFILIKISLQRVELLHLEVDMTSIALSIAAAKLPASVKWDDIRAVGKSLLMVQVPTASKSTLYHTMQQLKMALAGVVVKGLPSVNRCIVEASESGSKEYRLMVEGTDFLSVLATPGIDFRKAHYNNASEVARVLGIEAARICIIQEILDTMAHHGIGLDRRHVMLLADLMTYRGEVLGITRGGLARMKESVLLLASFERTMDHLFEASFFGQSDLVNGVSDSIILGVPMLLGTGLFQLAHKIPKDIPAPRQPFFADPTLNLPP